MTRMPSHAENAEPELFLFGERVPPKGGRGWRATRAGNRNSPKPRRHFRPEPRRRGQEFSKPVIHDATTISKNTGRRRGLYSSAKKKNDGPSFSPEGSNQHAPPSSKPLSQRPKQVVTAHLIGQSCDTGVPAGKYRPPPNGIVGLRRRVDGLSARRVEGTREEETSGPRPRPETGWGCCWVAGIFGARRVGVGGHRVSFRAVGRGRDLRAGVLFPGKILRDSTKTRLRRQPTGPRQETGRPLSAHLRPCGRHGIRE